VTWYFLHLLLSRKTTTKSECISCLILFGYGLLLFGGIVPVLTQSAGFPLACLWTPVILDFETRV
jgi:hypothetical protein